MKRNNINWFALSIIFTIGLSSCSSNTISFDINRQLILSEKNFSYITITGHGDGENYTITHSDNKSCWIFNSNKSIPINDIPHDYRIEKWSHQILNKELKIRANSVYLIDASSGESNTVPILIYTNGEGRVYKWQYYYGEDW